MGDGRFSALWAFGLSALSETLRFPSIEFGATQNILGPPSTLFLGGFPYGKKGTLILTSLLEDLVKIYFDRSKILKQLGDYGEFPTGSE